MEIWNTPQKPDKIKWTLNETELKSNTSQQKLPVTKKESHISVCPHSASQQYSCAWMTVSFGAGMFCHLSYIFHGACLFFCYTSKEFHQSALVNEDFCIRFVFFSGHWQIINNFCLLCMKLLGVKWGLKSKEKNRTNTVNLQPWLMWKCQFSLCALGLIW